MAFVRTVRQIKYHDVVNSGILGDEFPEKYPCERMKQALITLEEATEAYMVDVIAKFHCWKQQLMSCRFSTCLQQCQGMTLGTAGTVRHTPGIEYDQNGR
jgi:hypothetical protein